MNCCRTLFATKHLAKVTFTLQSHRFPDWLSAGLLTMLEAFKELLFSSAETLCTLRPIPVDRDSSLFGCCLIKGGKAAWPGRLHQIGLAKATQTLSKPTFRMVKIQQTFGKGQSEKCKNLVSFSTASGSHRCCWSCKYFWCSSPLNSPVRRSYGLCGRTIAESWYSVLRRSMS